jgi:hypothetical protein
MSTVETIASPLRETIEGDPDVQFAYLFGSAAKGRFRTSSDVDVAVFFDADRTGMSRAVGHISPMVGLAPGSPGSVPGYPQRPSRSAAPRCRNAGIGPTPTSSRFMICCLVNRSVAPARLAGWHIIHARANFVRAGACAVPLSLSPWQAWQLMR